MEEQPQQEVQMGSMPYEEDRSRQSRVAEGVKYSAHNPLCEKGIACDQCLQIYSDRNKQILIFTIRGQRGSCQFWREATLETVVSDNLFTHEA